MNLNIGTGKWRKDTPDTPGWYNASYFRDSKIVRWWNGDQWSMGVLATNTKAQAADAANRINYSNGILWRHLKPE